MSINLLIQKFNILVDWWVINKFGEHRTRQKRNGKFLYIFLICILIKNLIIINQYTVVLVSRSSTGPGPGQRSAKSARTRPWTVYGHGHFGEVMKSFLDSKKKFKKKDCHQIILRKKKPLPDKILYLSRSSHPHDKTIFSSGASHVTVADKLIEMEQYFAQETKNGLIRRQLPLHPECVS